LCRRRGVTPQGRLIEGIEGIDEEATWNGKHEIEVFDIRVPRRNFALIVMSMLPSIAISYMQQGKQ
jgi:hypothetical protein